MGQNPAADTGTIQGDLEAAVSTLLRAFVGPLSHALPGLVADMAQDRTLALMIRREVLGPRRRSMREALERAQARGDVRRDFDVELLLDMLTGPFYFRALFGHEPITRQTTRTIVEYLLRVIHS